MKKKVVTAFMMAALGSSLVFSQVTTIFLQTKF